MGFFDARKLLIESLVLVREAIVIDAEEMENRSLEIAYVYRVADDVVSKIIGFSVH